MKEQWARARCALGVVMIAMASAAVAVSVQATAPAQVQVKATVTPEKTAIGSRIRYELEVLAPAGVEILVVQPSERIGVFDIVDFGGAEPRQIEDGKVSLKRWWQLLAWSPGSYAIESPAVSYRQSGGEPQAVPPVTTTVEVMSVLDGADATADIRDIKPPKPIPFDWRPYYWIAVVVAAGAAFSFFLHWLRAYRRRDTATPVPPPPHVTATAALEALRSRRLPEDGAFKEYYSALTDIVRVYLEARFHLRAPEMTTEEFLVASSRDRRLGTAHRRLLGEFMGESDLVKFARHLPSIADSERAYEAARRFVDETAERAQEKDDVAR